MRKTRRNHAEAEPTAHISYQSKSNSSQSLTIDGLQFVAALLIGIHLTKFLLYLFLASIGKGSS